MYRPHAFLWRPAARERHASKADDLSDGVEALMLCGATHRVVLSWEAWLWSTCAACNAQAHLLVNGPRDMWGSLAR